MNIVKKITKYLYIITFTILVTTNITLVQAKTLNQKTVNIIDIQSAQAGNSSINSNWVKANATIAPSDDCNDGYSFDLLYYFNQEGCLTNTKLHVVGLSVPISPFQRHIEIIYNKYNRYDIMFVDDLVFELD